MVRMVNRKLHPPVQLKPPRSKVPAKRRDNKRSCIHHLSLHQKQLSPISGMQTWSKLVSSKYQSKHQKRQIFRPLYWSPARIVIKNTALHTLHQFPKGHCSQLIYPGNCLLIIAAIGNPNHVDVSMVAHLAGMEDLA